MIRVVAAIALVEMKLRLFTFINSSSYEWLLYAKVFWQFFLISLCPLSLSAPFILPLENCSTTEETSVLWFPEDGRWTRTKIRRHFCCHIFQFFGAQTALHRSINSYPVTFSFCIFAVLISNNYPGGLAKNNDCTQSLLVFTYFCFDQILEKFELNCTNTCLFVCVCVSEDFESSTA